MVVLMIVLAAGAGCVYHHDLTRPPSHALAVDLVPATRQAATTPYHLHLNGIGGYRWVDKYMLRGLQDAGLDGQVMAYDWTGADVGLGALLAKERHKEQSAKVAELLTAAWREQSGRRITITCHSGGAGITVWALEQLPDEVKIDSIVLLASALSPDYDLSPALRHVRNKVYSFYSPYDSAVLGYGTRMFGTIDGPKGDASGRVGFRKPAHPADPDQYLKLVQLPYDSAWMKMGNMGDHIGWMSRTFSHEVIAPALLEGKLPTISFNPDVLKIPPLPTSEPATPGTIPATVPVPSVPPAPSTTESEGRPAGGE
jgi:pimeloyl-ACP methyl ester carboxylesterase